MSSAKRLAARAASAIDVRTGFFSGVVVNTEESVTATLGTACSLLNAFTMPSSGEACMRQEPP